MDLLKLLNSPGWQIKLKNRCCVIEAPSHDDANELLDTWVDSLLKSAAALKGSIQIRWDGCKRPFTLTAEMAHTMIGEQEPAKSQQNSIFSTKQSLKSENLALFIPEIEVDLNLLYNNPLPVYINQLSDQKVLFANPAALKAQGKKPAEFLGESAAALNDPEELEYRDSLVIKDGFINEYQYSALRWYRDPETNFWRRKRMNFCSNFRQINYLGEECRLAIVLEAIDTGKTVGI